MTTTLERRSQHERLQRRIQIERKSGETGKSFRRHAGRMKLEGYFVKPVLNAVLRASGLYQRGVRNALQPAITHVQLRFANLPQRFDGFRILHLSDLHIDALPGLAERVAAALDGVCCDVCLMTGDYRFAIEGSCLRAWSGMRTVLSSISAPHGTFAILGNHDPSEMAPALERLGVRMLINESTAVHKDSESIWLAGVDDPYDFRCDDLATALEEVPPGAFKILLAHTPDLYRPAAAGGVDLYLCGHTHAGQVRLPWIGSIIQNSDAPRSHTHGYWRHRDIQGYTSRGIGCSMLPVRFNCPPEIVLMELKAD